MSTIELIGICIGIIATILGGVWFIVNQAFGIGKFSHKIDEVDKRTCNAACESHGKDIDSIKDDIKSIKSDVVVIKSLLAMKHRDAASIFSIKNSPRQLNDMGNKLLKDLQGAEFLKKNKDFLFAQIDASSPKTALDVENAAHAVCIACTDNEIFNGIKDFIYNAPSYTIPSSDGQAKSYDLSLPDACFVLSLPLRDMYLSAHPEILSE